MTPVTLRLTLCLALGGCFIAPSPVEAQTCDRAKTVESGTEAVEHVIAMNRDGCLGAAACDSALCKQLRPLLEGPPPTRAQAARGLHELLQAARGSANLDDDGDTVLTRMGLSLVQFADGGPTAAATWAIEGLVLFAAEDYEVDLEERLQRCNSSSDCATAIIRSATLIELATLFRRTLTKASEASRNAFATQLELLDKQWRSYLASSRGQYPWELALNSALYRKTGGFDAPPTSQWIFAHPGAAFELSRSTSDRQPSESLLLELAGVYRWSWREENMRQRWGGSLTMAWRDAGEGRQKLGYGVLAYLPRASTIGYVWRPQDGRDEHSLVLSADVIKFLRGTQGVKERLIGQR